MYATALILAAFQAKGNITAEIANSLAYFLNISEITQWS